ncbi:hypothetical protein M436DRAFT_58792 [Aureobasidium namibiae CBS 147.97]|uniref:Rhodopsin domain-containing protein n=1 Tax=Aureobasidium namibiae CBS 147.97 TaxID=1043004 RepID=A0A074W9M2_9PEZI|nr:uncharacterized protein M436DRAFT_58792 [Aureobasidium namibiae CBS 147.97]KEQ68319.1 hypothetical protein M436DRAFT_58792 [Aureobasidium namibiae CBS 147.97]
MVPDSAIVGFVWVLTAISGIIVVARSVMKFLRFRGLAWEDSLMIISLALAVVYGTSTILLYDLGLKQHTAFYSPEFAEYLYLCHAVGFMAPMFSRISFCLYMLRVLSTTSVTRKRLIYAFIALQLAVNVPVSIFVFTQCGSFQELWQHGIAQPSPSCVRHDIIKILALVAVVFNAATDLFLTILPAVVVWSIKVMTARARLGLAATLGLSFFATIASVIKIWCVYALYTYKPSLETVGRLVIVMGVEINVVIIAASIPVLAPLFLQKSGTNKKRMYKEPELKTYDTGAESAATKDISLQSSNTLGTSSSKTCNGSTQGKSVITRTMEVSSEDREAV